MLEVARQVVWLRHTSNRAPKRHRWWDVIGWIARRYGEP